MASYRVGQRPWYANSVLQVLREFPQATAVDFERMIPEPTGVGIAAWRARLKRLLELHIIKNIGIKYAPVYVIGDE